MSAVLEAIESDQARWEQVARTLAATTNDVGGRGAGFFVRLPNAIQLLLDAAKPADQPMVSFLKEAAVTVALQRLEASQK
jgi:hypothetical protein